MQENNNITAWQRVEAARNPERPTALYYINEIFQDFIELHGDALFGDDPSIVGGICMLDNTPITVIGIEKGVTTPQKIERNFGSPHPEGYRKAKRLMKQAEKFNRPVVCFVDTQGAYCGIGAEERGQGKAIADNLMTMIDLKVPVISIIIGEGGSGGALALAVADKIAVLENAIYSILSPEGFASILWKDSSRAKEAAEVMKLTAKDLKELNIIDDCIEEPEGGAQNDPEMVAQILKDYIKTNLAELIGLDKAVLVEQRYQKFRKMGSEYIIGV